MKIVKLNAALTAVFVVITVLAVVVFNAPLRRLVAVVDLLLFAIGVAAFIWGYFSAVQRSRSDEISVAALFLLIDGAASKSVMRIMPLLGLGLNGLWASKYGTFGKRILGEVSAPEGEIGKDSDHG